MAELKISFCIDTFETPEALTTAMSAKTYHLLLLDILFDGPAGMELAVRLRSRGVESSMIFISSSIDYVLDGYDVHAINYILKPPEEAKLRDAIQYALRYGPRPSLKLTLMCNGQPCTIEQQDILYLESELHAVHIYLNDGGQLRWWGKLDELAAELTDIFIAKCHKSIWVNLSYIRHVRGAQIELRNGTYLPISRSCSSLFKAQYAEYMAH